MTGRLHPALIAGGLGRVVNLSSGAHRLGNIDFEDIHFKNREYNKFEAYGQSKTANILFTRELDRRLQKQGIRSFAVHPGVIMTKLGCHMTEEDIQQLTTGRALTMKSPEAGAATSLYAATAPELEGQGGLYLEDCQIAPLAESADATAGYNDYAYDMEAAARLWDVSENLVGEKFAI